MLTVTNVWLISYDLMQPTRSNQSVLNDRPDSVYKGALKMQEWKLQEKTAEVEIAGVEKAGVDRTGGNCRSGKYGSENV